MRKILLCVALFTSLNSMPAMAQGRDLDTELAHGRVDITTGFNGTQVVLFGTTRHPGASLAVMLKGPERTIVVRRKEKILGAWASRSSVEFRRVPSYYDYALTNGGISPVNMSVLQEEQIGVDNLAFYPENTEDPQVAGLFRDALIRQMQLKGFFPIRAKDFIFIDPHFFKVVFDLPPGVPTGLYQVETVLYNEGRVLARETRKLQVGQVGFNAKVYLHAQNNALFYGFFAVCIAVFSGWGAFTFLRRD